MSPRRALTALLVVACSLGACGDMIAPPKRQRVPAAEASAATQTPTAVPADQNTPPELRVVTGAELRAEIAKSGRKATLVNVWASWCGSCKKEVPMLLELARGLASEGVTLILVSADEPNSRDKAVELLRADGADLPSRALGGGVDSFRHAIDERWQGAIPATFLLDASGKVRYFWNGPVLETEISPVVQGLLAGEAIDGMSDLAAH
jgi:thiol-disulfide isomerase/thioredoxin